MASRGKVCTKSDLNLADVDPVNEPVTAVRANRACGAPLTGCMPPVGVMLHHLTTPAPRDARASPP